MLSRKKMAQKYDEVDIFTPQNSTAACRCAVFWAPLRRYMYMSIFLPTLV
jgi:hypothetical protein